MHTVRHQPRLEAADGKSSAPTVAAIEQQLVELVAGYHRLIEMQQAAWGADRRGAAETKKRRLRPRQRAASPRVESLAAKGEPAADARRQASTSNDAYGRAPSSARQLTKKNEACYRRVRPTTSTSSIIRTQLHTCRPWGGASSMRSSSLHCAACSGLASIAHQRFLQREALHRRIFHNSQSPSPDPLHRARSH